MLIASPVNEPSVAPLGCGAFCVGAVVALGLALGCGALCVGAVVALGLALGFEVACFVGFAAVLLLGAALGFACGTPLAIDVVLDKFGGVIVNTAPNPPIVPPAIKSALFIF